MAGVKSFTGTSTGNTYNVGQQYSTSRGVVEAQADGTFKNISTGQSSKGSSEAVAIASSFLGSGSSGAEASHGYSGGKQSVKVEFGSGAGNARAGTEGAQASPQGGPGAARVTSQGGFFSGVSDAFKTTALHWGGMEMNLNHTNSDGGDFEDRWGEWGGGLAGLVVMGADLSHMAAGEVARQKARYEAASQEARGKEILTRADGKPHGMSDANWLQTQLNAYARKQAVVKLHDPAIDGLSSLIGNPHEPGNFFDFGSWWK